MTAGTRRAVATAVVALTVAACGGSDGDTDVSGAANDVSTTMTAERSTESATGGEFCDAMAHLIILLAPSGRSRPDETEATFVEAATWFQQAERAAPDELAPDVSTYAAAYGEYIDYLSTVGWNLDAVFATPEGKQLAIDTSHTMTPSIVEYAIGTCGLSFGEETNEPPEGGTEP
jgi:hypothetical protein